MVLLLVDLAIVKSKIMKKVKLVFALFVSVAMLITSFYSCKKTPAPTPTPLGTLMFYLHTNVDTNEVTTLGVPYIMNKGARKISVNVAQLYISGIQLTKSDSSTFNFPHTIILQKQQTKRYTIGKIPLGNYVSVKFNVGLNPTVNASNPAAADSTLNQPAMWFSTTAQPSTYVFVNFQGTIDTSATANGDMQPFSYKIGLDSNLRTISMPIQNCSFFENQVQYIHMVVDYNKLFHGIQLNVNSNLFMNTTGANSTALGSQIANNIPLMFRYEN